MTRDELEKGNIGSTGTGRSAQSGEMKTLSGFVSLHPYFKVHPGKQETFTVAFPGFIARTTSEEKNLFYEFTVNSDEIFCREAYTDAEGLLAHLDNVGAMLAEALKIADLTRIEVHGPTAELEKLKGPLAHFEAGVV